MTEQKHYQFWRVEFHSLNSTLYYWGESECLEDVINDIEGDVRTEHECTTTHDSFYHVTFKNQMYAKIFPLKKGER